MTKKTVAVLGTTGMLGWMVFDTLARESGFELIATVRDPALAEEGCGKYPDVDWRTLDAENDVGDAIIKAISGASWVINCIGVIKPYIHDDNPDEVLRALQVNSLFPDRLARVAGAVNARILQIATDCVYSGKKGDYLESDPHDALDVYGKTKSLGEVHYPNVHHLRCSIIGPELKAHVSLLDWFLRQQRNAEVGGFTNHRWNGVTTLHFARVCLGIIDRNLELPHLQNVIPSGTVSKHELIESFAREYGRADVKISPTEAALVVNRTLSTDNEELNRKLWSAAGYSVPPAVDRMVEEMACIRSNNFQ